MINLQSFRKDKCAYVPYLSPHYSEPNPHVKRYVEDCYVYSGLPTSYCSNQAINMKLLSGSYEFNKHRSLYLKIVMAILILMVLQFILLIADINLALGYFILPIVYVTTKYNNKEKAIAGKLIWHFSITLFVMLLFYLKIEIVSDLVHFTFLCGYIYAIWVCLVLK